MSHRYNLNISSSLITKEKETDDINFNKIF